MKCGTTYAVCFAVLLTAASAQATIPSPLPPINIVLDPNVGGQQVDMRISGTWPNSCNPLGFDVTVGPGATMWIDLYLRSYYDPNCPPPDCFPANPTWEVLASPAGPFPAGVYSVYARAIDCNAVGDYELVIKRFQIGIGQGGGGGGHKRPGGAFAFGQCVVLLQDDPVSGLRAGQAGTIICCNTTDCSGSVLVSWDLWTQAKDDTSGCVDLPAVLFPTGSATWVDPDTLLLGRPFNQCGTIRQGLEGCVYFEADDGMAYGVVSQSDLYAELDTKGGFEFDQRVRLRGLLDASVPDPNVITICPVRDGDVYHPILSACQPTPTGCCSGTLYPGDRVTLLVDEPTGPNGRTATGLMAGTGGTVICCEGPYGANWVFVSWDDWTSGVNSDSSCASTLITYVKGSGWWVPCEDITPAGGGGGFVVKVGGNTINLKEDPSAPNPQQTLIGCTTVTLQANFRAQLSVEATATSDAGGTWTGTITPDVVDAGTSSVQICVRGENVDLTAVAPGDSRQLASLSIYAQPAP